MRQTRSIACGTLGTPLRLPALTAAATHGAWQTARRVRRILAVLATMAVIVWLMASFGRADELPPFELVLRAPGVGPSASDSGPAMQHPLRSPDARPALRSAAAADVAQLLSLPAQHEPPMDREMPAPQSPVAPPAVPTGPYPQTGVTSDLAIRPIAALTINILPSTGRLPQFLDRTESTEGQLGKNEFHRDLIDYAYRWEATAFYCNPLYFEQPNLERYGYHWGVLQPFVSGAQFFVKIPLMPYGLANHHRREPIYSLGYYRPGSYAPYQINWPEARIWPAFVEGGFITALVYLIP